MIEYVGVGNLYVVLFADRLRRDGAGGDAVPAGRLAAVRARGDRRAATIGDQPAADHGAADRGRRSWATRSTTGSATGSGRRCSRSEDSRLLNKKHLLRAQEFYEKYGGKTIILARFVPIVRTFAPFVAGIGQDELLPLLRSTTSSAAIAWVLICVAGRLLLRRACAFVKKNFELVIVAIIVISVLPMVVEILRRASGRRRPGASALVEATTIGRSEKA